MREPGSPLPVRIAFGPFVLDGVQGCLWRAGSVVPLRRKAWEVLYRLASRRGEVVSNDELLDAVWGRVAVSAQVLTNVIHEVRVALGDTGDTPLPGVTLADQFGPVTATVKKLKVLCDPVDKNGEAPTAPTHPEHLACYQVKQTDATKFVKRTDRFVNNQFGPETLDAKKPALLCVPAVTTP